MTEEELQGIEQRLREIAGESGLGWAIDQADEWIAEGVTEEDVSPPRRSYNSWNTRGYEFEAVRGWSAPSRALKFVDRPVSERVGILIEALYRVLTELPAIERAMMKNFAPPTELRVTPVASVSFAPDQDLPEFEVRILSMDSEPSLDTADGDERARMRSVALLSELRALVGPS